VLRRPLWQACKQHFWNTFLHNWKFLLSTEFHKLRNLKENNIALAGFDHLSKKLKPCSKVTVSNIECCCTACCQNCFDTCTQSITEHLRGWKKSLQCIFLQKLFESIKSDYLELSSCSYQECCKTETLQNMHKLKLRHKHWFLSRTLKQFSKI
jgi:hypothetical protein